MSIAFLICTEPGRLEGQSLLLAESIRKFCGQLKDTPIYSFHPRMGEPISIQSRKAFEKLDVIHQQIPINTKFHDYYLANKPLVCAYAEKNIDADILVFIDSDKCFFAEPNEFLLPEGFNVRIRPEYGKGVGSSGSLDRQDAYWKKIYEIAGVKREVFVTTPIANKRIRGYWNSGLVAVRRSAGIFQTWQENFEKAMHLQLAPPQGVYFLEQSILSATISALEENISSFSSAYSYPLPLHNQLSKQAKINSFDEFVSIHYFNLFYYYDWLRQLNKLKDMEISSDKYQWLCEAVNRYNMPYQSISHRQMLKIRAIEQKLRGFNLNIPLSNWFESFIAKV